MALKSLQEHNNAAKAKYEPDGARPNGIACPVCDAELVDSDPHYTLTSHPPQKGIKCLSCHYVGTRIA